MRRFLLMVLVGGVLAACGGAKVEPTPQPVNNDDVVATSVAATIAAGQTTNQNTAAATNTPDNTVATVEANAPNTSFATALELDGKVTASVKESTFYYKLAVPAGGAVTSTLRVDRASPSSINVSFFDKDQNYITQDEVNPGETAGIGYIFGAPDGGPVYWSVNGQATFTLAAEAAKQDDAGTGGDAASQDDFTKATLIKIGDYSGVIGFGDRTDLYAVELPKKGGRLTVDLNTQNGDIDLQTFNNAQNYMDTGKATTTEPAVLARLLPVQAGGRWYVRLNGEGEYALKLKFTPQDDAKSGSDAGDFGEYSDATEIKLGEHQGELGNDDKYDLYAVDLPKHGGTLTVTLQTKRGTLNLQTYNNDRNYMDNASVNENDPGSLTRILPLESGGRWFIQVDGEGEYTLNVQFVPQNDADSKKDAAGFAEYEKALPVSATTFSGFMGGDDQYDIYKIPGSAGRNVKVVLVSGSGTVNVQIFNNNRNYGPTGQASSPGAETTIAVEGTEDYYIQLEGDTVSYRVEITP